MSSYETAVKHLVNVCAALQHGEKVLVISDDNTQELGILIIKTCEKIAGRVQHIVLAPLQMHGQEPGEKTAQAMLENTVCFFITGMSLAHSQACLQALANGSRCLSLPDYSWETLASPALNIDFRMLTKPAQLIADIFSHGEMAVINSGRGAKMTIPLVGGKGNAAPGWCSGPGTLASPPNAEANIAPPVGGSCGTLFVDGSIPHPKIGLLSDPLELTVADGRVVNIRGKNHEILSSFLASNPPECAVVAELGVGLNPKAEMKGSMLEDEGAAGTIHIGLGANITLGGQNSVPFHLDLVIRKATVEVDQKPLVIEGSLTEEISQWMP